MSGLTLLFAWCHKIECTCGHSFTFSLGLCHRAVLIVFLGLLIPIAHIALVMNLVERFELE